MQNKNTDQVSQGVSPNSPVLGNNLITNQNNIDQIKPKKRSFLFLLLSIGLITISIIGTLAWFKIQLRPVTKDDVFQSISIPSGSTSLEIADNLERKGIIRSSTAFLWYIKLTRQTSLQAGVYRLSSGSSTPGIIKILESGKVESKNILISPGLRLKEITEILIKAGFEAEEIEYALRESRIHPLVKNLDSSVPLEGYLFPDTYTINQDTTAKQLITLMLDTFQSKITSEIKNGIKKQGLTQEQSIILASIVQKEVADFPTQQKVAQVFLKRLQEGRPLGSDVTYMYASKETGGKADPSLESPYNTRRVTGLPPSAISNFNIEALKAVASPTSTSYNYFVAGDNGITYFSKTLEQHEEYTRLHCQSCFQ